MIQALYTHKGVQRFAAGRRAGASELEFHSRAGFITRGAGAVALRLGRHLASFDHVFGEAHFFGQHATGRSKHAHTLLGEYGLHLFALLRRRAGNLLLHLSYGFVRLGAASQLAGNFSEAWPQDLGMRWKRGKEQ